VNIKKLREYCPPSSPTNDKMRLIQRQRKAGGAFTFRGVQQVKEFALFAVPQIGYDGKHLARAAVDIGKPTGPGGN
jgi:hypothetical protein